jgi:hypothetical protein
MAYKKPTKSSRKKRKLEAQRDFTLPTMNWGQCTWGDISHDEGAILTEEHINTAIVTAVNTSGRIVTVATPTNDTHPVRERLRQDRIWMQEMNRIMEEGTQRMMDTVFPKKEKKPIVPKFKRNLPDWF